MSEKPYHINGYSVSEYITKMQADEKRFSILMFFIGFIIGSIITSIILK